MNPITLLARFVLLAQIAYTAFIYASLPAVIPNAYDASGVAHRFAGRGIVWVFVALSLGLQLLMTLLARHPEYFNVPADLSHASDRPRQVAIAAELLHWVQLEIALLFASFTWELAHEAPRHQQSHWVTPAIVGVMLGTVLAALWRMKRPAQS